MQEILKTIDCQLTVLSAPEPDCWINLTAPTEMEINTICQEFEIERETVTAALDEEERSRIESDGNATLIVVDVPIIEIDDSSEFNVYTTIPLGIILQPNRILTICTRAVPILQDLKHLKPFHTHMKTRFILELLYKNATYFLRYLRQINRLSDQVEAKLHKSMRNKELIQLLALTKSLVYFTTSLRSNEVVLEKMMKYDVIKKYPEDTDLLEDVIIENKQAIEMADIYTGILSGMMDAFASVISNNLNIVMKTLTAITIVMTVPTVIASLFGMNVPIPFGLSQSPYAFLIVIAISAIVSLAVTLFMKRGKMF